MRSRSIRPHVLLLAPLLLLGVVAVGWAQTTRPADVTRVKLPLELPAIGNLEAVKQWRFGRIESVQAVGATDDLAIRIRTPDGATLEVVGPRVLEALSRESGWTPADERQAVTRAHYVERMIAFDVDGTGRIIAMMSLEPMDRSDSRLRRALR